MSLPIELLSFTASYRQISVVLNWTTASEINNDFFTVERSKDGKDFEESQIIDGAGNSTQVLNYSFCDEHPYSGISYYRLKQTDFDVHFSYSNVVFVNSKDEHLQILISPNPSNGNFTITSSAEIKNSRMEIINELGEKIYSDLFSKQIHLNIPSGIY